VGPFFRYLVWWPLSYAQFTRIPKALWFGSMFVSWSGFFLIGGLVIMPSLLKNNLYRVAVRELPGCWQQDGQNDIAIFYRPNRGGGNALYFYQAHSDEDRQFLERRGITSFSPRLAPMTPDQKYAPWTLSFDDYEPITIDVREDGRLDVTGNSMMPSGVWQTCDPPVDRSWQIRGRNA
jgi:hypothetical protein